MNIEVARWTDLQSYRWGTVFGPNADLLDNSSVGVEQPCIETSLPIVTLKNTVVVSDPAVCLIQDDYGKWICVEESPYLGRNADVASRCAENLTAHGRSLQHVGDAMCLCGEWSNNIWHWFTEFFPYAVLAEKNGFQGNYLIYAGSALQRESLNLVGINPARLIEHSAYFATRINRQLVIKRVLGQHIHDFPQLVTLANDAIRSLCRPQERSRRLYVSRKTRVVVNEQEVMDVLKPFGFESVSLENLSMREQFEAGAAASHIVGPHGAGLISAMYMQPGGTVAEFFSPEYVNPCMLDVCTILGHRYLQITSPKAAGHAYPHGLDIRVDMPALRASLSSMNL